mmetsp:Transcript_3507/g.4700  ORF Transcript_3507/g.4700 Transcript_3507/m.4700 type:complete len:460 (-) Transcript_3507:156-1535(-)
MAAPATRFDNVPINVEKIQVAPAEDSKNPKLRTSKSFVNDVFVKAKSSTTFGQLLQAIQEGTHAMEELGMYKTVDYQLKETTKPRVLDLIVKLKEKGSFYGSAGVGMSTVQRQPMMKIEGLYRNLFGNAESLKGSFSYGNDQTAGSFALTLSKPKAFKLNDSQPPFGTFAAMAHYNGGTLFRDSGFVEKSSGLTINGKSEDQKHNIEYLGAWRDVVPHEKPADTPHSNSVLKASMPSLKSSIRYTYTHETTDHKLVPTKGIFVKSSTEIAGFGGDVRFGKLEGCGRVHWPISSSVTASIGCFGGLLVPLGEGLNFFGTPSLLNDRFFHRGFRDLRIRGFTEFGPKDEGDAIGGDGYYTVGGSIAYSPPIQIFKDNNIRLHAFANAGNMQLLSDGDGDVLSRVAKLTSKDEVKASVGVGVIAPISIGRFEINLVAPVTTHHQGDFLPEIRFRWALDSDFS